MDWTFFATFTTPHPLSLYSARTLANRVHGKWGRLSDGQCSILWVAERNELRDGHHLHALVKLPEHFRQPHLHAALCEAYSVAAVGGKALSNDGGKVTYERRARIDLQRYDKRRNASGYLTKYMTKSRDLLDWDILLSK
jgi:hypothetical protein